MTFKGREEGRPKLENDRGIVLLSAEDAVDDEERIVGVGRLGEERNGKGREGRGGGDEGRREAMDVAKSGSEEGKEGRRVFRLMV